MPRPAITPEKRQEMRAHVREALLRIARRRGVTTGDIKGWREISIRNVIEEADISIGTFYRYFKDRSDLAQTLWQEPVNELRADMKERFDNAGTPQEKVRSLLQSYAEFAIKNRRLFRAVFLFVRPEENPEPEPVSLESEVLFQGLRQAFDEGKKAGVFKQFDSSEMAQLFWAAIHGSLAIPENFDRYDFDRPAELSSAMIEVLMEMIATKE